eukprot:TRINITY_DN4688_c0_g1_i1.p1 TRINITY_DN4688_c0_g1~~TRINITY_DN4688_c0_g1_i1.p1  ORF type:complete len:126 (+),score=25.62 TRINITY_DN4688_c0_g1_i1:205-582(+)
MEYGDYEDNAFLDQRTTNKIPPQFLGGGRRQHQRNGTDEYSNARGINYREDTILSNQARQPNLRPQQPALPATDDKGNGKMLQPPGPVPQSSTRTSVEDSPFTPISALSPLIQDWIIKGLSLIHI